MFNPTDCNIFTQSTAFPSESDDQTKTVEIILTMITMRRMIMMAIGI